MKKLISIMFVLFAAVSVYAGEIGGRSDYSTVQISRNAQTLCPSATNYILTVSSSSTSTIGARSGREKILIRNMDASNIVRMAFVVSSNTAAGLTASVLSTGITLDAKAASTFSIATATYTFTSVITNAKNTYDSNTYSGAIYLVQGTSFGSGAAASCTVEVYEEYR